MKLGLIVSFALVATALVACSSSSNDPTSETSGEDLSSSATGGTVKCPPGEKICQVANPKGICIDKCVIDTAMCIEIACRKCDPSSAAPPHPACSWDATQCQWDCPVCDPVGTAPHAGCSWDTSTCQWDCPVCDPAGSPPEPSCKWDSKACVWICL